MEDSSSFFYLKDIKRLFIKNKFLIFLVFIIFFIFALSFFITIEPKYQVEASFFEDSEKNQSKMVGSLKDIVLSNSDSAMSDAMSFFQTKKIAKKLVKKLALQISSFDEDNLLKRKYKIALKNLKLEFNKKIKDTKDIEYEDVIYRKNKSKSLYLNILDKNSFEVLDLNKNELIKGQIDKKIDLKDLSFRIKSIPKEFIDKTLKITVQPLDIVASTILSQIKVTKDKNKANFLILKTKNANRYLSSNILNTLMELYIEHLRKEKKIIAQKQLTFLKARKDNLEKELLNFYDNLEKYLQSNVKNSCFVNLDAQIAYVLRQKESLEKQLTEKLQKLKILRNIDLNKIDEITHLDENILTIVDNIKRLKEKKRSLALIIDNDYKIQSKGVLDIEKIITSENTIDNLIDEAQKNTFSSKKYSKDQKDQNSFVYKVFDITQNNVNYNTFSIFDLNEVKQEIKELSKKRDDIFLEKTQIKQILRDIDTKIFQSNLASIYVSDNLLKNVNEIAKKIEDEQNYTILEIETLKEELSLEKKVIVSQLEDCLNLKEMNLKFIDQKLNDLKKIKLNLLNQEIVFLTTKAKDLIFEKIRNLQFDKNFIKDKLKNLTDEMQNLVQKLTEEKKLLSKSEMTKNMIDSLTKLIESKNLDYNLNTISSKPVDLATLPTINIAIHLFRKSFIVAFFALFIFLIILIYRSAIEGFSISKEMLNDLNYDFFGKISFNCNGIDVEELKSNDLESLRKIISSIDSNNKVVTTICSSGPKYIHYLAALLAISSKNILVIETKSEINEKNGLFPYLEDTNKSLPIEHMQAYDFIPSGKHKYFAFELLKSLDFIQMIDTIKAKYDLILIYSDAKINSAEARIYLDVSDNIILTFKEEKFEDIKTFVNWTDEKSKLGFVTY